MSDLIRGPDELDALLKETLARAPHPIGAEDTWLFVYGSMLENPPFEAAERQVAVLHGFQRRFCLADPLLRGTQARPGLTLGLKPGDCCTGLSWRLDRDHARDAISAFWPGEMHLPLYVASWRTIEVKDQGETPALVLLADQASPLYLPDLAPEEVADRIASCSGSMGSNADYLYEAAGGLERAGIPDPVLEDVVGRVRAARPEGIAP